MIDGDFLLFDQAAGKGAFDFIRGEALGAADDVLLVLGLQGGVNGLIAPHGGEHGVELLLDLLRTGHGELHHRDLLFQFNRQREAGAHQEEGAGSAAHPFGKVAEQAHHPVVPQVRVKVAKQEDGEFGGFVNLGQSLQLAGQIAGAGAGLADGGLHALGHRPRVELPPELLGDSPHGRFDPRLLPRIDPHERVLGPHHHFNLAQGVHGAKLPAQRL